MSVITDDLARELVHSRRGIAKWMVCFSHPKSAEFPRGQLNTKKRPMRCTLCKHGETQAGMVTVILQRGDTTVIIKGVPAQICENCGEYYPNDEITERVLSMAEEAVKKNVELEILRFAA